MNTKKTRIAINGLGRIGRLVLKALLKKQDRVELVAINDLTDTKTLTHLLKYDSIHGIFTEEMSYDSENITIGKRKIQVLSERNPELLPWKKLDIDIVIECTGIFTDSQKLSSHLKAGAKKVILSAPAKGEDIKTIVLGVNDETITETDQILSNASCTTNCLAPMVKILDDHFGIDKGFITTVHAYTADQRLQDAPHRDLRRARAGACSIIPTSTGAAKAVGLVLPHLKGRLDGCAMRVPIPDGSLTDLTVIVKKQISIKNINEVMKTKAETSLKGILSYTEEPIVSIDIVGNQHSCVFDASLTNVNEKLVKVIGWYDNETGYSYRLVDLALKWSNI